MSFSVDKLGAYGLSGFDNTSSTSSINADKLQDSLEGINGATDEELMKVCKDFETYMIEQVIKAMEETVKDDEESSTSYMNMFGDKLTNSYAQAISDQGELGLAQMLYESMKRQ